MAKRPIPLTFKKGYHRHHIVPLHAGGLNHPWNIVYVKPWEHQDAHFARWIETGDTWDFIAYAGLSGIGEVTSMILAEAGHRGGTATVLNARAKGLLVGWEDKAKARNAGSKGGKKGGPAALAQSIEKNPLHQSDAGKVGGKVAAKIKVKCESCGFICRPVNLWRHHQAHSHKGRINV